MQSNPAGWQRNTSWRSRCCGDLTTWRCGSCHRGSRASWTLSLAFAKAVIKTGEALHHRARALPLGFFAQRMANGPAVDLSDRAEPCEGAGDKGFIRSVHVIKRERLLEHRNTVFAAKADDIAACDPRDAVFTCRGPHFGTTHDKKMC